MTSGLGQEVPRGHPALSWTASHGNDDFAKSTLLNKDIVCGLLSTWHLLAGRVRPNSLTWDHKNTWLWSVNYLSFLDFILSDAIKAFLRIVCGLLSARHSWAGRVNGFTWDHKNIILTCKLHVSQFLELHFVGCNKPVSAFHPCVCVCVCVDFRQQGRCLPSSQIYYPGHSGCMGSTVNTVMSSTHGCFISRCCFFSHCCCFFFCCCWFFSAPFPVAAVHVWTSCRLCRAASNMLWQQYWHCHSLLSCCHPSYELLDLDRAGLGILQDGWEHGIDNNRNILWKCFVKGSFHSDIRFM